MEFSFDGSCILLDAVVSCLNSCLIALIYDITEYLLVCSYYFENIYSWSKFLMINYQYLIYLFLSAWLLQTLFINGALLLLFYLQHSGMALLSYKQWLYRRGLGVIERSLYILATAIVIQVSSKLPRSSPRTRYHSIGNGVC